MKEKDEVRSKKLDEGLPGAMLISEASERATPFTLLSSSLAVFSLGISSLFHRLNAS